jgi:uncharacterized repeat protein (TIGR01451 family)/gliding motility-associated-like protein
MKRSTRLSCNKGFTDFLNNQKSLIFTFLLLLISVINQKTLAQSSVVVNSAQNNVPIEEVVLIVDRGGPNEQVIVQTSQGLPNPLPEDVRVEVESILLENGERIFATTRFPSVKSANPLLGSNMNAGGIRVVKYNHSAGDQYISHANNLAAFLEAMEDVVSTPDLRSYWDIGQTTILNEDSSFVDIIYPNQIPVSGYMMVSERNGNSSFDIMPLGEDGEIIPGATRIEVREQYDWNTGVNHQIDVPSQKQWLTILRPELFQVTEPIYGFRVFDIGESDGKFIFFAREVSAGPDVAGPIFGFFGEENVINIFDNDELDGNALDPAEINLTIFDDEGALANGFLILDTDPNSPTFGRVSVPAGLPAGIYTFEYEIEDKLDGRKDRALVTIRVVDPIDGPDFPDCRDGFDCDLSSDKVTVEAVYLSDAFGNPVAQTCEPGSNKEVYLALSISSNVDAPLFESRFIGDLKIGDNSLLVNAFIGTIAPNESAQIRILSEAFIWNCGDQISLDDVLVIWLDEEADIDNPVEDCEPYEEGQCISEIIISSPLSVNIDWTACEQDGAFTFNFQALVSGGSPEVNEEGQNIFNYTYEWDFQNNGEIDSNEANPVFVYQDNSTTQVRLVITDVTGVQVSKIKDLEYPDAIIISEDIIQPNPDQADGQIEISVEGGMGEIQVEWFRDEELVGSDLALENLSAGIYTVVISDEAGCEVSREFELIEKEFPFKDLEITKEASVSTYQSIGEVITYTITVTNTGNVPLENILVEDPITGLSETIELLEVGVNNAVVFNTDYVITQADLDLGRFVNLATASTEDIDKSVNETINAIQESGISITKTADKTEVQDEGEEINYTITVINTGNTTLTSILVKDPLTGLEESIESLVPGEELTFTTSYTVTEADILGLSPIVNVVLVSSKDPNDKDIKDGDEVEVEVICVDRTRIQGTIINQETGEPISNVPVLLIPQGGTPGDVIMQISRENGAYFFTDMAPGEYLVQVQDVGLNQVSDLYPVESSLLFTNVEVCEFVFHDFIYASSELPVIGDFVWYDLNGNGIQDEWFDANNDGVVTQNIPDENGYVPFSQWEWIDLNGDGRFDGPENEGELNKAGIGNVVNPNIFIEGPSNATYQSIIGITGYYRVRPDELGAYVVTLDLDDNLSEAAKALAATGLVKVIPNNSARAAESEENAAFTSCGVTTDNPYEIELTAVDRKRLDIDFGIVCQEEGEPLEIIANDDDFGTFSIDFTGVLGNILENDLLEGQRPDPSLVDFIFTDLDDIIGLSISEDGELSLLIPGVNEPREYILSYTLQESANPDNQDDAIVIIRILQDEVDLAITKSSNEIEIFEGDEFEYSIIVANNSNADATNVIVTDNLPSGVTFVSSSFTSTGGGVELTESVQGSQVIWTMPVLPANEIVEITLTVLANPLPNDSPLTITNSVTVIGDQEDPDDMNNQDTDTNVIRSFFIPNVITPEGDGLNDTFEIKGLNSFTNNEIVILNRYGDHVFQRVNYQNDWAAEGLVAGTYFYILKTTDAQGRIHEFKGWIQVIK